MTDHDEKHLLSGAHSLNSLTPDEAAEFENYIEGSEEARAEAAGLADTAVRLGLATPAVEPPPELKSRLMAAIRTTPQLSPIAEPVVAEPVVAEPVEASAGEPSPAAAAEASPAAAPPEASRADFAGPAARRAQSRWFMRPVALLSAAAAAVVLFAGGTLLGQSMAPQAGDPALQAQAASLVELSAADDAQRAQSTVAGGGQATLIWSPQLHRSAIVIDKLPELPAGKTYQLWYIDAAGAKPAGTFESSDGGKTWHVLKGKMSGGDTVGVTVEPDGGSAQPTTKPIVAIASA